MIILSLTFHTEETKIADWQNYLTTELEKKINGFEKKYILSEVETEMLSEGKNTNLLLFFQQEKELNLFLEQEFPKISQEIFSQFQESVLIFKTLLKNVKTNI